MPAETGTGGVEEKAAPAETVEGKAAEGRGERPNVPAVKPEAKVAPVFDMTLLFGNPVKKAAKAPVAEVREARAEKKQQEPRAAVREAEEKKPVPAGRAAMPEFSFLGNAAAKGGAQKSGAAAKPAESAESAGRTAAKSVSAERGVARSERPAGTSARMTAKEGGQVSGNGANMPSASTSGTGSAGNGGSAASTSGASRHKPPSAGRTRTRAKPSRDARRGFEGRVSEEAALLGRRLF